MGKTQTKPDAKLVTLAGPQHVHFTFEQDGQVYQVGNGTVTPRLEEGRVPSTLFGYGFVVVPEETGSKE